MKNLKTIGILGGMGPLATADLFSQIIARTRARNDNEHIPVLIDSNTRIPDRTAALLHGGESPCKEMVRSALRLEHMGADFLIMPCNTAHGFYQEIVAYTNLPLVNMIEETALEIVRQGIRRVGLLATDGTLRTGIYSEMFKKHAIDFLEPDANEQTAVMDLIYKGIKAGNYSLDLSDFYRTLQGMEERGVEAFVLGCTELPIAFEKFAIPNRAINPTAILAKRAIVLAGGEPS